MSRKPYWTADQFKAWQKSLNLTGTKAAKVLGFSKESIYNYRRVGCRKNVALACIGYYSGIEKPLPWKNPEIFLNGR